MSSARTAALAAAVAVVCGAIMVPTTAAAAPQDVPPPPSNGAVFTAVAPTRVLDTRVGTGGRLGAVGAGQTIRLTLPPAVPAGATAVVLNVTGVAATANTYVTVFPAGAPRPTASSLNLAPGDTRPNQVTATLGVDRSIDLFNNAGNTHLVADMAGFYAPGEGSKFTALPGHRVLDTRTAGSGPVGPGGHVGASFLRLIPPSATSVTVNLTATQVTAATYVTAWSGSGTRPTASSMNLVAGDTRANLVTVALTNGEYIELFNNAGTTHLIVDLVGFHTPEFGSHFLARTPERILDTRSGTPNAPVATSVSVPVKWPDYVTGALLNVTATQATTDTFVHVGSQSGYSTSTLNLKPGQTVPNAAVAQAKAGEAMRVYNNAGTTHVIADVAGVFVGQGACVSECVVAWGMGVHDSVGVRPNVSMSAQLPVTGVAGAKAIASSTDTGYALKTDGTVLAWGGNEFGQLGTGWTGAVSPMPVPVMGLTGVSQIAAGEYTGYALRDGVVVRWGRAPLYGNANPFPKPVISGATEIAASEVNGFAVVGGQVWGWGSAYRGLLGPNYTEGSAEPVKIWGLTDVRDIAAGEYTGYAIKNDGTVWAWGANGAGELGNGVACDTATGQGCGSAQPVQVSGLTDVRSVSSAQWRTYAVLGDGSVWAWGGSKTTTPVKLTGLADITQVAATPGGGYALRADGTVLGWGSNHFGELANDGAGKLVGDPVVVGGLTGVKSLAGGRHAGYALTGS